MTKSRPFTSEQNEWFREHYREYGKHHIAEAFNEKFNDHRTMDTLWSKAKRMKLTGNGAEYKAAMCKKHFSVPIGTEHTTSSGYILVKYKEDKNGKSKNWMTKQQYVWEKNFGKVPEGYCVIFLDNDKTNFSLDNLCCVPNGQLTTLGKKNWKSSNPQITKTALLWCELYSLAKGEMLQEGYEDEGLCVFSPYKLR